MASQRRSPPPPPQLQNSIRALGSSSSSTSTSTTVVVLLLLVLLPGELTVCNPDDEACLSNLYSSINNPSNHLKDWTKSTFSFPCNGLTSYLRGATCNNGRVYKLSLSNLSLTGTISPYISNCTNLQALDLSSNSLTGPIPPSLSSLLNLVILNLSANHLSGQIPQELGDCTYLNVIDLHSNGLTGPIPNTLALLTRLSWLDLSDNRLEGPIPRMLVNRSSSRGPTFNASSFAGNKGLYGYPLPPAGRRSLSVLAIVGIGLGSGLFSLVLSFTIVCVWLRLTEEKTGTAGEEGKIHDLTPDY